MHSVRVSFRLSARVVTFAARCERNNCIDACCYRKCLYRIVLQKLWCTIKLLKDYWYFIFISLTSRSRQMYCRCISITLNSICQLFLLKFLRYILSVSVVRWLLPIIAHIHTYKPHIPLRKLIATQGSLVMKNPI